MPRELPICLSVIAIFGPEAQVEGARAPALTGLVARPPPVEVAMPSP